MAAPQIPLNFGFSQEPRTPALTPRLVSTKTGARMTSAEAKTLFPAFPAFPAFLDFVKSLKGDEKSEAQTFLDRLFKALGHATAYALATCLGSF
jgi:hypothetical protein